LLPFWLQCLWEVEHRFPLQGQFHILHTVITTILAIAVGLHTTGPLNALFNQRLDDFVADIVFDLD
jgi:hypothetical protein